MANLSFIIDAAKKLCYRQGFNMTTLADVGFEADVSLGTFYYYFKTKEDIGIAVLDSMMLEQTVLLQSLDKELSSKARLLYFFEYAKQKAKLIALQGCRTGKLCQEFGKEGGMLYNLAAKIMMDSLLWIERQFYTLGFIEKAFDLSLALMYR